MVRCSAEVRSNKECPLIGPFTDPPVTLVRDSIRQKGER